jgi:hypothetical protein
VVELRGANQRGDRDRASAVGLGDLGVVADAGDPLTAPSLPPGTLKPGGSTRR